MFAATKIDPWFLKQIFLINEIAMTVREAETLTPKLLKKAKLAGLSDVQVAHLRGLGDEGENTIRELRWTYGLRRSTRPSTPAPPSSRPRPPHYYSTYDQENEAAEASRADDGAEKRKVLVLGSGPIRIGQGIEFDYCSVHCVWALKKAGCETVIVNNNPGNGFHGF